MFTQLIPRESLGGQGVEGRADVLQHHGIWQCTVDRTPTSTCRESQISIISLGASVVAMVVWFQVSWRKSRSPMRERDLLQTCGDALTPDTCLMPQEGRTKQFILELIVEFHSETVYRIKIARFCTDYSHLRLVMNSERPNSEHSNSREGGRWCDRGPTRWEWERECVPRVVWAGPKELSSDALRRPRERGTVQSVGGHRRQ
ncbi:uncharacterized protein LOC125090298 isoform X2 [Lutra lutra]|uniref:uncharacterized protein LOC125090298 isoform X2 n=1 Tax=Lutra lutra TaxID=9657 RepID=UPI001FD16335|nr:uncharacterized protein LOC125090298 isoform X2 [Lutra lutra]